MESFHARFYPVKYPSGSVQYRCHLFSPIPMLETACVLSNRPLLGAIHR
ncbi:hypothetical protein XM38_035160 [Halomicronema hongdechloris C2206]|uniref:Uncharacterized protein n=1 Tax=Halomicronema hongdechloris C2206 TaxID=1641165 RepID=A0A1Z3HQI5_9CYAN|nr:hypothetical protein XM38_035160 [Halomicronema hongdechloris C2206]